MLKKGWLIIILLFLSNTIMAADIAATYQYSDGQTMTISVRDSSNVRMDTTPESYMLLKGEKIYILSKDEAGNWSAMDLDQMKGMAGMMGGLLGKKKDVGFVMCKPETFRTQNFHRFIFRAFGNICVKSLILISQIFCGIGRIPFSAFIYQN